MAGMSCKLVLNTLLWCSMIAMIATTFPVAHSFQLLPAVRQLPSLGTLLPSRLGSLLTNPKSAFRKAPAVAAHLQPSKDSQRNNGSQFPTPRDERRSIPTGFSVQPVHALMRRQLRAKVPYIQMLTDAWEAVKAGASSAVEVKAAVVPCS